VMQGDLRIQEAIRMGFRTCVCPRRSQPRGSETSGFQLIEVQEVKEALKRILNLKR